MENDNTKTVDIHEISFRGVFGRNRSVKFKLVQSLVSKDDVWSKFNNVKAKKGRGSYVLKTGELCNRGSYESLTQSIYQSPKEKQNFIVDNSILEVL